MYLYTFLVDLHAKGKKRKLLHLLFALSSQLVWIEFGDRTMVDIQFEIVTL